MVLLPLMIFMASPGLLAGLGLRLSGVTDNRSPDELRLSREPLLLRSWTCCRSRMFPEPFLLGEEEEEEEEKRRKK